MRTSFSGSRKRKRSLHRGISSRRFLLAWSAAEAAIRLLLADEGVPGAGITTAGHVLGQAVSLGVISRDEYRSLTRLQAYRNVIVHGYSHDDLGEKAARELIEIVRGLTAATV